MKKFLIGLVLTLFILSLLPLVIYITYQNMEMEEVEVLENIHEESIESEAVESSESIESKAIEDSESIEELELRAREQEENHNINMGTLHSDLMNPDPNSGNHYQPWEMDQVTFTDSIHRMTHQKVYAQFKEGAYEMNEENIELLLHALEEPTYYDDADYYREVLTEWENGDFSNAVEVHNKIWLEEGGSIGKAERLLTPEEEQDFVERNFRY